MYRLMALLLIATTLTTGFTCSKNQSESNPTLETSTVSTAPENSGVEVEVQEVSEVGSEEKPLESSQQ